MTPDTYCDLLAQLIQHPSNESLADFTEWKAYFNRLSAMESSTCHRAIIAGYQSNCVGFAFAAGYQSALHSMVPSLPNDKISALCVTEENGNHPRAIETTLKNHEDNWQLTGKKKFITGGLGADTLLVAANTGETQQDRPVIKMVKVNRDCNGVAVNPMPQLPFVPEIEHATVEFSQVKCSQDNLLEGDGYADYVKPFRTIEDIYVSLALSSYLLKVSRLLKLPKEICELALANLNQHAFLTTLTATKPMTHLLVASARRQLENFIPLLEPLWQERDANSYSNWLRDKALLNIASTPRNLRTEKAWAQFT